MSLPPGKLPPYAEEIEDSRIGTQASFLGSIQPPMRVFRVYCIGATDSPIATIESLSTADGGVKRGSPYPTSGRWHYPDYVLDVFTILGHIPDNKVWILGAEYVPSYIAAMPKSAWTFRISGSLTMERADVEIPWTDDAGNAVTGRGVGPPRYIIRPPILYRPSTGPGIIQEGYANNSRRFAAKSTNPEEPDAELQLPGDTTGQGPNSDPRNPKLPRHIKGMDVPEGAAVLSITKRVNQWKQSAVEQALKYVKPPHVNQDDLIIQCMVGSAIMPIKFASAPSNPFLGSMLFSDFQLDPIEREQGFFSATGVRGAGEAFQVTMQFLFSNKPWGWQHREIHTYKWDDGTESPITDDEGNYIDETFHRVNPTFLSNIVSAF